MRIEDIRLRNKLQCGLSGEDADVLFAEIDSLRDDMDALRRSYAASSRQARAEELEIHADALSTDLSTPASTTVTVLRKRAQWLREETR